MCAKVSIVVPVYGVEKYIEKCARSLFEQNLSDLEYLFIDDCSPDNSVSVLRSVLEDYPLRKKQVMIYKMERNSGQAAVRTWGVLHATGDFIAHCDSDDWVEPDYCSAMYEKAISENADAVICDYVTTDGEKIIKRVNGCRTTDKNQLINRMLFQSDPWSLWNKLFRRTACYREDLVFPKGNMGEDMVMTFQLVLNAQKISYIEKPLYNYFFNPASITKTMQDEKLLNNYNQLKANSDLLLHVFEVKGVVKQHNRGILSWKWFVKKYLWNISTKKAIQKQWRESYPEITLTVLMSPLFSFKEKCKYLMTNFGLYPFK